MQLQQLLFQFSSEKLCVFIRRRRPQRRADIDRDEQ